MVTFLIGWGDEHGLTPREMAVKYASDRRGFRILSAYHAWKHEIEEREVKKAKNQKP